MNAFSFHNVVIYLFDYYNVYFPEVLEIINFHFTLHRTPKVHMHTTNRDREREKETLEAS